MKTNSAFDKWFSKNGSIIPSPGDAGYEGYIERRTSWQASLEWVLKTTDKHYYAFENKFDVYKMIKEELKNLNQSNSKGNNSP